MKVGDIEGQRAGIQLITAYNLHFSGEHEDKQAMINHALAENQATLLAYPDRDATLPMNEETGKILVANSVKAARYVAGCAVALSQYVIDKGIVRFSAKDVEFSHLDVDKPDSTVTTADLSNIEKATLAATGSARAYLYYFTQLRLYSDRDIRRIEKQIIGSED